MRAFLGTLIALLLLGAAGGRHQAVAQGPGCAKSDFESVVNEAGSVLRDLNRKNTPVFQAKLRTLKEKRNWGNDEFLKQAEPFVRDDRIVAYDQKSEELLVRITGGGQTGSAAKQADCALLAELRAALGVLLETQKEKWTYMLTKIEQELAK
jgi:hypothetical protein